MNPKKKSTTRKTAPAAATGKTGAEGADGAGELTFEAALERLEAIVGRLEDGEIPLEESIEAYAEGTRLVRRCLEKLDRAETMIRELSEKAEGFRLEASPLGEDDDDDSAEDDEDDDEDPSDELPF